MWNESDPIWSRKYVSCTDMSWVGVIVKWQEWNVIVSVSVSVSDITSLSASALIITYSFIQA